MRTRFSTICRALGLKFANSVNVFYALDFVFTYHPPVYILLYVRFTTKANSRFVWSEQCTARYHKLLIKRASSPIAPALSAGSFRVLIWEISRVPGN